MRRNAIVLVAVGIVLIAVPFVVTNEFYLNLASQILIYALLALSLNLLLGYGGMVSLGHASFLGLASYAAVLLLNAGYGQLLSAILAIIFSTLCGAFFGLLALRASGIGFLMITLALGQIVWGIAYRANTITDGDNGLRYAARPQPFGIDINGAPNFYWFTLIVFAIALFFIWRVTRSPFGPMIRRRSPGITVSDTSLVAGRPPKRLLKPMTSSAGVMRRAPVFLAHAIAATVGARPARCRTA